MVLACNKDVTFRIFQNRRGAACFSIELMRLGNVEGVTIQLVMCLENR